MALEATFRSLRTCLHKVDDVMHALHITMEEPEHDQAAVADDLTDKTLELLGTVHEAQSAAESALKALGDPPSMDLARRSLAACQERFHRIEQRFSADLASYKTLAELVRVAGRSKQWAAWANSATRGVEDCRQPLEQASEALAACWQELAEHTGSTSVSVRTTSIGQRIVAKPSEANDLGYERIT